MKIFLSLLICLSSTALLAQFNLPKDLSEEIGGIVHIDSIDMEQDGDLDLLVASLGKLYWYKNAAGTFEIEQQVLFTGVQNSLTNITTGDIDNDSDIDILFLHLDSIGDFYIKKIENLGSGFFGSPVILPLDFGTFWNPDIYFELEDIDNDGNIDILQTQATTNVSQSLEQLNWAKGNGNGSFMPLALIDLIPYSRFKMMDFDVDGDLDIFYYNTNKLCVQENIGLAQFATIDTIAQLITMNIQFVDLNGDNYLDLNIVSSANGLGNTPLYSVINNAGVFGVPTLIPASSFEITCINNGDFDDDGDQDILVNYAGTTYTFGTSSLGWYENNGFGTLGSFHEIDGYALGVGACAVGDFTGDGKHDVITAMGTGYYAGNIAVALYPYTPLGIQAPYTPIAEQADGVYAITSSDIDLDGLIDVVVTSNFDKTVSWHKNLGNGNWGPIAIISEHATTNNPNGSQSSIVIDLDNDGDDDIITSAYWDPSLAYYENLGGGNFSNEIVLSSAYLNSVSLLKADMNNDGFEDVIVVTTGSNAEIVWIKNNGLGSLTTEHFITNSFTRPIVSDLDQDGDSDVIGISGGTIRWSRNIGAGVFSAATTLTTFTLPTSHDIEVGDLNADGELDIIIGSSNSGLAHGRVTVAYNNGGAISFTNEILHTFNGVAPKTIQVADFDLDGDLDIFNLSNNGLGTMFENIGNDQFSIEDVTVSTNAINAVSEIEDYDMDGDLDLFISNTSGVSYLENLAGSMFKASGQIYYDLNQNGAFDGNDFGTDQFGVSSTFSDAIIDMDNFGNYHIIYSDTAFGIFESQPILAPNWAITSTPTSYIQTINGSYINQANNDFGVHPTVFENDVSMDFTGGFPGCLDLINLWITASNHGTTIPSLTYELILAPGLTYASSNITPDSIVGQSIFWHTDSLLYFSDSLFNIRVATPNATFAGDTLVSTLITNVNDATGALPQTLLDSISQIVNCSSPATHVSGKPSGTQIFTVDEFIDPNTQYMEYLILFQNTTPSMAEYLMIRDQLDTNLVWSSIEIISSSHPATFNLNVNAQKVDFHFDHIHLPNVGSSYIGSKGFIKYRMDIKPNRPFPTVIKNSCTPYFDVSAGQLSNITLHKIYNCDSTIATANLLSESCIDEAITGNIAENVTLTDKVWIIPNIYTDLGNSFYWNADTAGTFNVNLTISNNYCSADTTFTLTIHPEYEPPTEILGICAGDSIVLYGQYTSTPGIYYNSLQSVHGCDSIVSTELIELPLPMVSFYSLITLTCVNYPPTPLTNTSPPNGQLVGPGIVSNTFDPSIAGVGVHTLYYYYTDANGCTNSDSIQIVVDGCVDMLEGFDNSNLLTTYNAENKEIILSISESGERNYSFGIYDMNGKLIVEDRIKSNALMKIGAQSFQSGVYYVLLRETSGATNPYFRKIQIY